MKKKAFRQLLVKAFIVGAIGGGINQILLHADRRAEKRQRINQLKKELSDWSCSNEANEMSTKQFMDTLAQKWQFIDMVARFD